MFAADVTARTLRPSASSPLYLCVRRNPESTLIRLLIQSELIDSAVQQRCCNALLGRFLPKLGPWLCHGLFLWNQAKRAAGNDACALHGSRSPGVPLRSSPAALIGLDP